MMIPVHFTALLNSRYLQPVCISLINGLTKNAIRIMKSIIICYLLIKKDRKVLLGEKKVNFCKRQLWVFTALLCYPQRSIHPKPQTHHPLEAGSAPLEGTCCSQSPATRLPAQVWGKLAKFSEGTLHRKQVCLLTQPHCWALMPSRRTVLAAKSSQTCSCLFVHQVILNQTQIFSTTSVCYLAHPPFVVPMLNLFYHLFRKKVIDYFERILYFLKVV